jgi:hypothetical protein
MIAVKLRNLRTSSDPGYPAEPTRTHFQPANLLFLEIPGRFWKSGNGWNSASNLLLWRISQEYRKISTPPLFGENKYAAAH